MRYWKAFRDGVRLSYWERYRDHWISSAKWLSARHNRALRYVENAWRGRLVWERADFDEGREGHRHAPLFSIFPYSVWFVHGLLFYVLRVFEGTAAVNVRVCSKHRASFGIKWRRRKKLCQVPERVASHRSHRSKKHTGDRTINKKLSEEIFNRTGSLTPIGSGIHLYYCYLLGMSH